MASLSRYDKVKAVGKYAASLVYDVQRDYVSGSGSNARVGLGSRDCTGTWMGYPRLGC